MSTIFLKLGRHAINIDHIKDMEIINDTTTKINFGVGNYSIVVNINIDDLLSMINNKGV